MNLYFCLTFQKGPRGTSQPTNSSCWAGPARDARMRLGVQYPAPDIVHHRPDVKQLAAKVLAAGRLHRSLHQRSCHGQPAAFQLQRHLPVGHTLSSLHTSASVCGSQGP